jgi:hypothetical protein
MVIIEGIAQTRAFVSISQILFPSLSKECVLSDGVTKKKRVTRPNNEFDYGYGPNQSGLPSDLLRQTTFSDPFSPNSFQNISTCIH